MDHAVCDHSALAPRPGTPSAFVALFLEHWEPCAPTGAERGPRRIGEFGSLAPGLRWTTPHATFAATTHPGTAPHGLS